MKVRFLTGVLLAGAILCGGARDAVAAMSFCNRTAGPVEAALGYRDDTDNTSWVTEGWWRIEPGQCARVYGQPLTQRFYFYYAHALTQIIKDTPPTTWSGKYMLCTDDKAFRIEGDSDCQSRNYLATGFQELDLGANTRDYTLDFKDNAGR
jgi:uncharacterized membrane protein